MSKKLLVSIISVILMIACLFTFVACNDNGGDNTESTQSLSGDSSSGDGGETKFSAKILVVSDVHIADDALGKDHLKKTLLYAKNNGINAVVFNGDIIDLGTQEFYDKVNAVFEDAYGSFDKKDLPELIFNMGNHEFYPSGNCAYEETVYDREVANFKAFAEKWGATIEDNVFVRDIQGVKCVIAFPGADLNYTAPDDISIGGNVIRRSGETVYYAATGGYSQADVDKVKGKIDGILSTGYDKPLLFFTHHPLGETYGSTLYGMLSESETKFKDMLKDYPQIVHLAGHTHFSSLHDRSFVQNDWTSIQTGMHATGKFVSGVDYDEEDNLLEYANITGKRYNASDDDARAYNGYTHFGMLLTFDNEKMTADRIDLSLGEVYPHGSYEVPYGITKENKHDKFYYEQGERTGETLNFGEDTDLNAKIENGRLTEVSFKDVDEYWACEGYEIVVTDKDGNKLKRILWSSHFWMGLKEKQTYKIALSDIAKKDEYTVRLRAINFFGAFSDSVTITAKEASDHEPISAQAGYTNGDREMKAYSTVTFAYKITSGNRFSVAILDDSWSSYYGYFGFIESGAEGEYAGVNCETREDGYVEVTMDLSEITVVTGETPETVNLFYIHPGSDAKLLIDYIYFED